MTSLILAAALLGQCNGINGSCQLPVAMLSPPLPPAGYAFPAYTPSPLAYAPLVSTQVSGCPCACPSCVCNRAMATGYAVPSAPMAYAVSRTTVTYSGPRRGFRPLRLFRGGCCR